MKNSMKILSMVLLLLCIACGNDDDTNTSCQDTPITLTSLETAYDCINTPYQLEINLQNTFSIIHTQNAFDALTSGECTPQIDFETYDLIIGKQGLTNGFESITYSATEDCMTQAVALRVTIILDLTTIAPNITYHVLIPKLTNPQATTVEVQVN